MSTDISKVGLQKVKSLKNGELSEIEPVLRKNNIKLIGVGVEEYGSEEFINRKLFAGDLYYVEDISTYEKLDFKRFGVISILAAVFWKQTREAIFKGREMGLGGDMNGNWGQTGGALLVQKGGKLLHHFVQSGPGDHLPNQEILKHFGLENEYNPEIMANKTREDLQCNLKTKS